MSGELSRVEVQDDYESFLKSKLWPGVEYENGYALVPEMDGIHRDEPQEAAARPHLHEHQRFAVAFALARKRSAMFMECGLGKTSVALAWADTLRTEGPVLIVAPLAAIPEFFNERDAFFPGLAMEHVETSDVGAWLSGGEGIGVVSHHAFLKTRDLSRIAAMVLDESSILKSGEGKIARSLVRSAEPVTYRLALSATPAPNDPTEYATHSTFLGYTRSDSEFRARFFVRDGKFWRLKGHAEEEFPKWMSRFAIWMTDPAAYGFERKGLPADPYSVEYVDLSSPPDTPDARRDLFGEPEGMGISRRAKMRRSLYRHVARTEKAVEIAAGHRTIIWTKLNDHADRLERALREAGVKVEQIAGRTDEGERVEIVRRFKSGQTEAIVSKPSVIGHGVNLQEADRMIFAGYDESYESFHQAVRRAHRQGREGSLSVYVLMAPEERPVVRSLERKAERWRDDAARQERLFAKSLSNDVHSFRTGEPMRSFDDDVEFADPVETDHYRLVHGDCIKVMDEMEPESVDLSVFSPPFASLFTYSSERSDMGNCRDGGSAEFDIHFQHFAKRLFRVMKKGRVVALHLAQLIAFRSRHGRKGLRDFRGRVIEIMEDAGFHFYGEFVVPKNPQAAAIRTKTERLQFSQLKRDSLECSPALNDYVLEFRRPGKQETHVETDVTNEEWIRWASGVWDDIDETAVLSHYNARGEDDEKHICPLQLPVIERCVRLWSNPRETVFSPFAGVGSEVYVAIQQRRFGYGIELKREYFDQAVRYVEEAVSETYHQGNLDLVGSSA